MNYFVCAPVALIIQHAMCMRPIILSSVARLTPQYISHYLTDCRILGGKFTIYKCLYWFSVLLLSKTFLVLRRTERDIVNNVKYSVFLSDFNKIWIFPMDFRKTLKYHMSRKSVNWKPNCVMRTTDERTDMAKLTVALRSVAITPKMCRTSAYFNPYRTNVENRVSS